MERLNTIAVDVQHTVFDNETEAIMYVTKDFYADRYIIAIPVYTFAWSISFEQPEHDYNDLLKVTGVFGTPGRKEKLVEAIKDAISDIEG